MAPAVVIINKDIPPDFYKNTNTQKVPEDVVMFHTPLTVQAWGNLITKSSFNPDIISAAVVPESDI